MTQRAHEGPPGAEPNEGEGAETLASHEGPTPASVARRPPWRRAVELVLPVVLSAGAMGMHWWLNVPDRIVQSSSDQGAKDKKDKKADKADKDKKKDAERKARSGRDEARTVEELDAEWVQYNTTPFDEEPTRTAWARRHQTVINRVVVEARRHAFAGAPEESNVVLASTSCRSVRCRFMLRSSFTHELDLMTSALERMQVGDEPLWRSFQVEPVAPTEPPANESLTQHAVQVTVAFGTDETEVGALSVPAATPDNEPENGGEPEEP